MTRPPFDDAGLAPFGPEGIFCHPQAAATAIGETDARWARLTEALGQIDDVSIGSPKLTPYLHDKLAKKALSPHAANVLRPLAHLFAGRDILELNAGPGARTPLIAENAKRVVAVSQTLGEARLLRRRLRHAGHVDAVCAQVEELPHGHKFDVIVAMGSLDAASPADAIAWLFHVRPWLKAGGLLLLGMTNALSPAQMTNQDARTQPFGAPRFGRRAISQMMDRVGLVGQRIYCAFPALKDASLVLSQEGAAAGLDALRPVLTELREHGARRGDATWQASLWPEIAHNQLLLELAPSFVLVARDTLFAEGDDVLRDADDLAYGYATKRPKALFKESVLRAVEGRLDVTRRRLYPLLPPSHKGIVQRLDDEALPHGETLEHRLHVALETPGWSAASLARSLRPWAELLGRHEKERGPHIRGVVSGHFLDVGPTNVAIGPHGQPEAFSLEWDSGEDVPLTWVMYRGLRRALLRQHAVALPAADESMQVNELLRRILNHLDVPLSAQDIYTLEQRERETFDWQAHEPQSPETLRVRST